MDPLGPLTPLSMPAATGGARGAVRAVATRGGGAALFGAALAGMTLVAVAHAAAPSATSGPLPPEVRAALATAKVPDDALAVVVQEAGATAPALAWQDTVPMNPASLVKLATVTAALDRLGPAFTWRTPVWVAGRVADGVLDGSVHLRGSGDPTLTIDRVAQFMTRLRQFGVREITGDFVVDRSLFAPADRTASDFDGEPLRPHNVQADAFLLNFRALLFTFTPDPPRARVVVSVEPPLDGVAVDAAVTLGSGACDDWRRGLQASLGDPLRPRFAGAYPATCGERQWPVAYPEPAAFDARMLAAMWRQAGGRLAGTVRDGPAPADPPSFVLESRPLADVARDINKHSNNVMADQLLLTWAATQRQPATAADARDLLAGWIVERTGEPAADVVVDNGSGLSRRSRLSARALARLLQAAYASPTMPELLATLPVAGVDGTMRRARSAVGRAHLKTGSLRDVAGVAGIVLGDSGSRWIVVAMINHPNANAARPALDAVVQWAAADTARRPTPRLP